MKAGRLDRVVTGSQVSSQLESCTLKVDCHEQQFPNLFIKPKETLSFYPVSETFENLPLVLVYQVNVKKLINDVYHGNGGLAPHKREREKSTDSKGVLTRSDFDEVTPDLTVIQSVFSAILSWGLDQPTDELCSTKLGLVRPVDSITFGSRGANGFLTFPINCGHSDPKSEWCISPSFSAMRLITILSLSRSILSTKGFEHEINQLISHYGESVSKIVGPGFCFPSLAFLAKYWQDPVVDVQQAARTLFEITLKNSESEDLQSSIGSWRSYCIVPLGSKSMNKVAMRAAIILGIIGCESTALDLKTAKDVAESLDVILKDEAKNAYRLLAVEIIGKGFLVWEPHLNAPNVLRYLVSLTGLVAMAPPPSSTMSPTVSGGNALAGHSPFSHPIITAPAAAQLTPGIMLMARQALIQIASVNAGLFISTLTFDLSHGRQSAGSLKLMGMFISKKPILLFPHLATIVDAMVKTLDPNTPHTRESLQQIVTVNIAELVTSFPCISFHASSQRLAAGTLSGPVVVYDLRTATKLLLLEGHTSPVHAVSFSPDGKLIATFSAEENCVRIFQPHSGFLGTLMGALSGSNAGNATGHALATVSGVGRIKSFRDFNVGPRQSLLLLSKVLEEVKFEWIGDRELRLCSLDSFQLVFKV